MFGVTMEDRCKQRVPDGGRSVGFHRCSFKAWKDGYCKKHHPDTVKKRRAKSDTKYKLEWKIRDLGWEINAVEQECVALVYALTTKYPQAAKLANKIEQLKKQQQAAREKLEKL
jgi:septal ring factor EnvC (AmiA/AmiB activator)